MIFSKNRGKMATLIVAISCISLIFSLIPLGAAAADCGHTNTYPTYESYSDGTHSIYYTCSDCHYTYEFNRVTCSLTDAGSCIYCGYSISCYNGHDIHSQPWKCVSTGNLTHTAYYMCNNCDEIVIVYGESCFNYDQSYCMCGQKVLECSHPASSLEHDFRTNNNGTHTPFDYCNGCGSYFYFSAVSCTGMLDGECDDCGYRSSDYIECGHGYPEYDSYVKGDGVTHVVDVLCSNCHRVMRTGVTSCTLKNQYIANEDNLTHSYYKVCACGYRAFVRNEDHLYIGNTCSLCEYSRSLEGIPDNSFPGYIYQDELGRWAVLTDRYFGGVNVLNLTLLAPYYFSSSTVDVITLNTNEVVILDEDGAPNKSNSKIVDFKLVNHSWLEHGEWYTFSYSVDSPCKDSVLTLAVKDTSGKTSYLKNGSSFQFNEGYVYTLNFKTNSSSSTSVGYSFSARYYNIQINKGNYVASFEPFGLRYFNNELSYSDFQTKQLLLSSTVATYSAVLDYYNNVAYGGVGSLYSSRLSSVSMLLSNFDKYYNEAASDLSSGTGEFIKILDKITSSSTNNNGYNRGYSDGYGAALRDFENVSEGGFVEGLINGGFSAVSESWNILTSGVSISGISVAEFVSSVVIILLVFFAVKIIAR